MSEASFKAILATLEEAANDNRDAEETARNVVLDLMTAGFAIKRCHARVDYALPIKVLYNPSKGSAGTFDATAHLMAPSVDDLMGAAGWLVIWSEQGRTRSAWFDPEGVSRKLPDHRVVNPKTPCAGAIAAANATPAQKVA